MTYPAFSNQANLGSREEFLDELRAQLAETGDNERKLLNLCKRMARIRVFDLGCGSGNFLESRAASWQRTSAGKLLGIELRDFPAEIARFPLIIAEFQCEKSVSALIGSGNCKPCSAGRRSSSLLD